jgi:sigma-B regulation protein RsbU (phosphoserine phosphatase)
VERTQEIRRERTASWLAPSVRVSVDQTVMAAAELARRNQVLEAQLTALRRDHDELRRVLLDAAQAQRRLCGPRHLHRGDFEVAGEIFPVRHLSGDFICAMEQGPDLVLAIGDIAGKGLDAGMWFNQVVSIIRRRAASEWDPAAAVAAVNRDFCQTPIAVPMTTLFLARLDLAAGALSYCNAGHPPALLLRSDGNSELLHEGGPVLGALKEVEYSSGQAVLQKGDLVLAYSDGIAECRNETGEEFGGDRVSAALAASAGSSAISRLFSVLGAVEDFAGVHQREDDIALLVVEREM